MNDVQHSETTDRHLIEAITNGDGAPFQQIIERHQAMVFRTCLRVLRNQADAEDAAQATFIVLHKKCSTLPQGTVLGGWLYRTAELVCREFLRSSKRRQRREEETAAMNRSVVQDSTEVWNSLEPELDSALMTLPQMYRDVVVLRYLEGKSTSESAAEIGVSVSVVTTRLSRAIEQLRDWFCRRGIALSAGVLSVTLAENANAGQVPTSLAGTILGVTGSATAAGSANASVMVKGALAKMSSAVWIIFEALLFITWVDSMVSWVRSGCPIPRWVHILARALLVAGVAMTAALGVMGILTPLWAVACILVPPAAAYLGWLWMFGPDHVSKF